MDKYGHIFKQYDSLPNHTTTIEIEHIFNEAREIDPINGINDIFIEMLSTRTYSIEQMNFMINFGADPGYCEGLPIVVACRTHRAEIIKMLLDNYHINIEKYNNDLNKIATRIGFEDDTLKLLLDNGLVPNKELLECRLLRNNIQEINLFDYGIELSSLLHICQNVYRRDMGRIKDQTVHYILDCIKMSNEILDPILLAKSLEVFIYYCQISIDEINMMIDKEVDIRYNNDIFMVNMCRWPDVNVLKYLIEVCHCDVNAHNSIGLYNTIYRGYNEEKRDCTENINYLLELGCKISDETIGVAIITKAELLKLFIDYGTDPVRIASMINQSLRPNTKKSIAFMLQNYPSIKLIEQNEK